MGRFFNNYAPCVTIFRRSFVKIHALTHHITGKKHTFATLPEQLRQHTEKNSKKEMKKHENYVSPTVTITEVMIEAGFALSAETTPYPNEDWN